MENHRVTEEIPTENQPDKIAEAALWFSSNADNVLGNPVLELMSRFKLCVMDAVGASKQAHAIRYPRTSETPPAPSSEAQR